MIWIKSKRSKFWHSINIRCAGSATISLSTRTKESIKTGLSLTLVRMLPVFFPPAGLRTNTEGRLFVGWFGPRGLASIVFIVIVVSADLPNDGVLAMAVACTVILGLLLSFTLTKLAG